MPAKETTTVSVVKDVTYPEVSRVYGWSVLETNSAAVALVLRDGGATGDIQAWINVVADATANMTYARAKLFPNGLHIVATTGAFTMKVDV